MRYMHMHKLCEGKGVYGKQDGTPPKGKKGRRGSRPEENYIDKSLETQARRVVNSSHPILVLLFQLPNQSLHTSPLICGNLFG